MFEIYCDTSLKLSFTIILNFVLVSCSIDSFLLKMMIQQPLAERNCRILIRICASKIDLTVQRRWYTWCQPSISRHNDKMAKLAPAWTELGTTQPMVTHRCAWKLEYNCIFPNESKTPQVWYQTRKSMIIEVIFYNCGWIL